MTRPTGRTRVFLGAYQPPKNYDEMTGAERYAWAEAVADAMAAAYRQAGHADGQGVPDADPPAPRDGPIIGVDSADDVEPE